MLAAIALVAVSLSRIAAVGADRPAAIVALPFSGPAGTVDVAADALSSAVVNALPKATADRGLSSVRAESVQPVGEALRACRDDGCRNKNARRLGARWAIVGAVDHGALLLKLVDVEVGDVSASERVDGDPPAVLARVPAAVDHLVDAVAPLAQHALVSAVKKAHRARAAGDLDGADTAFAEAIGENPANVDLWLERARLYDAADRKRETATWDAFARALGPGSPGFAALNDVDKARVRTALHEDLDARADYDERADHLDAAARVRLRIAALFPGEASDQSLRAAELLARAGSDDARPILERLAKDDSVDDDVRLRALSALHAR
ncbi:MAG TPA: hypothetical protein VGO62_03740 [Myxococcota bacterium]